MMNSRLWRSFGKWIKRVWVVLSLYVLLLPLTGSASVMWSYSLKGICALSVSETEGLMAVGCKDGSYYIFDTWGNILGHGSVPSAVTSLDIADSGDLLIGSATGYTFCKRNGAQISSFLSSPVRSVSISLEGTISLVCSQSNLFINMKNSMLHQRQVLDEFPFGVVSSDGRLACAAVDTSLLVYSNGMFQEPYDLHEEIGYLSVSKDGKITFFTKNGKIGYMDAENKELQFIDLASTIGGMGASSRGDVILVFTESKLVWVEKGSVTKESYFDGKICLISLSEDGSFAGIGKEDGTYQIMTMDGTAVLTYDFGSEVVASEMCQEKHMAVVCTNDGICTFQLQEEQANNHFVPIPSRKSLPLTSSFEESWSVPVEENATFFTADVDGDGLTEIVLKEGTAIKLLDGNGIQESIKDLEIPFYWFSSLDFDEDTVPEISIMFDYSIFTFSTYDWKEEIIRDYYINSLGENTAFNEGRVIPFACVDSDEDGENDILASVSAGYSCKPRGIVCIDSTSGNAEWFYQTGPGVQPGVVKDIDGDGNTDIVVGSVAPCNCGNDEQFPDCETYVIALSNTGKELWKVHLGKGYRRVAVCAEDVNSHEGIEIVGFGYEASENWGKVFVLNCFGEYLRESEVEYSIFHGAVCDIDADSNKEIITVDSRGYISILTSDLEKISEKFVKDDMNSRSQLYVNDINGDDFCEILLAAGKELFIFDRNLNVLQEKEFGDEINFTIANFSRCKNTVLILSDKLYAFSYQDMGDAPCPPWLVTERTLREEGTRYLNIAESSFAVREYRGSKPHFEHALHIFSQLEDQKMVDSVSNRLNELSEIIFKSNVRIGIVSLGSFDSFLCMFVPYQWITKRRWHHSIEIVLLLNFPFLLGLLQVYFALELYISVFVRYFIPSFIFCSTILLRGKLLGFLRTVSAFFGGHKDMLVLSITKQSDEVYRVSVESIEERFNPIKESKEIMFPIETRRELIKKVDFMIAVLNQFSSVEAQKKSLGYAENVLKEVATTIYHNFIPEDFSDILRAKFLLLEVEDVEIPWELMYSDDFFALRYAVSRRIVTTESVTVHPSNRKKGRRALVISNPSGDLLGARVECEIIYKRLKQKMDVVYIEGNDANSRRIANQFGQGFDIIHFAGHVDNGLLLSDGLMSPQDLKEFIVGTPIVFVNGCKSEDLARAFLLGGAMAYVGTIHPIHDESAASIAADFYDLCLQYQIGEALRRARQYHAARDIVWASLIMYGDPTLKLL